VIYEQDGDFVKAEMMIKEAYRIWLRLYGKDNCFVTESEFLLAKLLNTQGMEAYRV
jgi:hypothetical protein